MRLGLVALCLVCFLAACQSPSAMEEQGPSAAPSSQGFMMARSNCLPHDALMGLFKAYPQGRFFLNTSHGIVARDTKPPELKARTLEKLEQETAVPAGQTVWVTALLDQREVSVNISHGHMDVKAGPYLWALRGKPRESAAAFVDGAVTLFKAAGVRSAQWTLDFNDLTPADVQRLCERLGVAELECFGVSSTGRLVPQQPVSPSQLGKVQRPALARRDLPGGRLNVQLLEGIEDFLVEIESADADAFERLAELAESP
ncbi:MAG: hypothetical protein HPKKFMNG_01772 [Planctomycetes bacterium]|nr:hypothetical protein [Planctomycetota bacterium]HRJ79091.1 hypothetical protein [Planctomycetota bacterium]